jgi:hypothetical protein
LSVEQCTFLERGIAKGARGVQVYKTANVYAEVNDDEATILIGDESHDEMTKVVDAIRGHGFIYIEQWYHDDTLGVDVMRLSR